MNTINISKAIAQQGNISTEAALQLFDDLEPVDIEFMISKWKGSGFHTNHQMDGLLKVFNWYGKEFISADSVHPLLFSDGNSIFKVDPNPTIINLGLSLPIPRNEAMKPLYIQMSKIFKTEDSKARVRMMDYRDKVSATMIYDYLPINDVFRKVDDNIVLGLMDFKRISQPFFFLLNRV